MELRVLKYYLVTVQEGSITGAAKALHLSQPTLSKQLRELEDEIGKPLLIRGSRNVTMTEEGMVLRRRAEELFKLVGKMKSEIIAVDSNSLFGKIVIGTGESRGVHTLTKTMAGIRKKYPGLSFEMISGDTDDVIKGLEDGSMDFGLVFGNVDRKKYESMELPYRDRWGLLIRKDSWLADKDSITLDDMMGAPLIVSRQLAGTNYLDEWFGDNYRYINIVGQYTLINNAALMVEDNIGNAIVIDSVLNLTGDTHLCFRPLEPEKAIKLNVIWKKYIEFSRPANIFHDELKQIIAKEQSKRENAIFIGY